MRFTGSFDIAHHGPENFSARRHGCRVGHSFLNNRNYDEQMRSIRVSGVVLNEGVSLWQSGLIWWFRLGDTDAHAVSIHVRSMVVPRENVGLYQNTANRHRRGVWIQSDRLDATCALARAYGHRLFFLFFLLVRAALTLRSLRLHTPRVCRLAVFLDYYFHVHVVVLLLLRPSPTLLSSSLLPIQ